MRRNKTWNESPSSPCRACGVLVTTFFFSFGPSCSFRSVDPTHRLLPPSGIDTPLTLGTPTLDLTPTQGFVASCCAGTWWSNRSTVRTTLACTGVRCVGGANRVEHGDAKFQFDFARRRWPSVWRPGKTSQGAESTESTVALTKGCGFRAVPGPKEGSLECGQRAAGLLEVGASQASKRPCEFWPIALMVTWHHMPYASNMSKKVPFVEPERSRPCKDLPEPSFVRGLLTPRREGLLFLSLGHAAEAASSKAGRGSVQQLAHNHYSIDYMEHVMVATRFEFFLLNVLLR